MVFPVVGGDGKPTGYEIENSGRFDNTGGSALGTTFGTATNSKKFTLSFWYKICSGTTSGGRTIFGGRSGYENIFIHEDTIRMDWNNASSGTVNWAPLVRDHSAWYHFVIAQDTSQSTDSNRVKFYINGVQAGIRSGVTLSYPAQNLESGYNVSGVDFFLSSYNGTAAEVNAYYADVYFVDGQQYAPTVFAETDDNGVWIPKEAKDDVSFGNNGFFLEFKQTGTGTNSSGIGADTSGNDNHLSVAGLAAQDITTDTPTNNFATLNPLDRHANVVLSEGNLQTVNTSTGGHYPIFTNMAFKNGKWYAEFKRADGNNWKAAIMSIEHDGGSLSVDSTVGNSTSSVNKVGYGINVSNGNKTHNTTNASYGSEIGSILMWAFDADNGKIWWGEDGTWFASGDPAAGSNEAFSSIDTDTLWTLAFHTYNGHNLIANFGNPPFSISSGNSDANGYGNFEYAPPSGFYALCTKNLAEYG